MKFHHKLAILGTSATVLGLIGLSPLALSWVHAKNALSEASRTMPSPQPQPEAEKYSKPIRLQVSSVGIDISIVEGSYNPQTGEWTLTNNKAQFALPTIAPNQKSGNILIYGHDTPRVFAGLHSMPLGAHAKVTTANGDVYTYAYRSQEVVDPTNTDIFAYKGKPQLTLQTCTGFWSEARQFFYFDLVSVDK